MIKVRKPQKEIEVSTILPRIGILKAKQKLDVTFNFDKQDVIDFKNDNVQGLRNKFIKVVVDPLFFGQKNYKGLLFYQLAKGNLIVK